MNRPGPVADITATVCRDLAHEEKIGEVNRLGYAIFVNELNGRRGEVHLSSLEDIRRHWVSIDADGAPPRVIDGLHEGLYHDRPEMSVSRLKIMHRSAAHFHAGSEAIGADTARFGRAFHHAVLEGGGRLLEMPAWSRIEGGKSGRSWKAWLVERDIDSDLMKRPADEWFGAIEAVTGLLPVTAAEMMKVRGMRARLEREPCLRHIVERRGHAERTVLGELCGMPFRIRCDYWSVAEDGTFWLDDLKSVFDASEGAFAQAASRYLWQIQAAAYSSLAERVLEWPRFRFVAIEKKPPYELACYQLDDAVIANGRAWVEYLIARTRLCREREEWPSYPHNEYLKIRTDDPWRASSDGLDTVLGLSIEPEAAAEGAVMESIPVLGDEGFASCATH